MQEPISNKIRLGDTLNTLDDYAGVPPINDEGTLENLIGKVDKVRGFLKTGKADGDLSRYFPNILTITRQSQLLVNYLGRLMQALRIKIKINWNLY